jgi:hypothetical protein
VILSMTMLSSTVLRRQAITVVVDVVIQFLQLEMLVVRIDQLSVCFLLAGFP